MNFEQVSDQRLVAMLKTFVGCERRLVAKVVAYLIEVEKRRLHLAEACTSMHDFCVRKLGMSEGETHRRLTAARLLADFPQLLEPLSRGRVQLTHLVELRPYITESNVDGVVGAASGKTKKEIAELIARLAPQPDVPATIELVQEQAPLLAVARGGRDRPPAVVPPSRQVAPLAPERYRVTFTAGPEFRDLIELARDLTRHRNPTGDIGLLMESALPLLIEKLKKERFAATERPRKSRGSKDPANIAAVVRREVSERDKYQCAFHNAEGERCPARGALEVDHIQPRACGGTGDAANLRLRCRAHNLYEAERVFGSDHIKDKINARRRRSIRSKRALSSAATETSEPSASELSESLSKDSLASAARKISSESSARDPERVPGLPHEAASSSVVTAPWSTENALRSATASPRKDPRAPREIIRGALMTMRFTAKQADAAIGAMPVDGWSRPLESLVCEALALLT